MRNRICCCFKDHNGKTNKSKNCSRREEVRVRIGEEIRRSREKWLREEEDGVGIGWGEKISSELFEKKHSTSQSLALSNYDLSLSLVVWFNYKTLKAKWKGERHVSEWVRKGVRCAISLSLFLPKVSRQLDRSWFNYMKFLSIAVEGKRQTVCLP